MNNTEKDFKIVRKNFENERVLDRIRFGNNFVDDFLFEGQQMADIPINALRVIFNIINIISNEQFRPEDRPRQLSLFDEEFETDNNVFISMKIKNSKISPSGSTKQVVDAYEFLAKFKMGWYKSMNMKGREIKTFGGLITSPSYDQRGYTSFLISSYWLKKLIVIPEYNYILYYLVYNIQNNKHILFAIWLSKVPESGITLNLSTFNKKFGLNYKTARDFCLKFLKPLRHNLDKFNALSFNYKHQQNSILIYPYLTKTIQDKELLNDTRENLINTYRLNYFKKRFNLKEEDLSQFIFQYKTIPKTKDLIEQAYKIFIKRIRLKKEKSSNYQGKLFLQELQKIIIELYQTTKVAQILPNGYPTIL